jgi:transcriptional regulator with XRE-family HTH domain
LTAGYSAIPSFEFLQELEDDKFRNDFVADRVRTRLALLIRSLREQRGWSQAELGERLGKPQSVISRIEDPDYGRLSTKTLYEVAAAFGLPVYIDLPNWDEWFRLMEDMSARSMARQPFNAASLNALASGTITPVPQPSLAATASQVLIAGSSFGSTVAGYYPYQRAAGFAISDNEQIPVYQGICGGGIAGVTAAVPGLTNTTISGGTFIDNHQSNFAPQSSNSLPSGDQIGPLTALSQVNWDVVARPIPALRSATMLQQAEPADNGMAA